MTTSLMQQALGSQWQDLPVSLQAHYQETTNMDIGTLDIDYPRAMQPYLSLMRLMGALVNQRGKNVPTTVEKYMQDDTQYWKRSISFPNGKTIYFKSHWVYAKGNELIEYINPILGLRMAVSVKDKQLHYSGKSYVVKLGKFLLPIPEWLVLGHTTIVETALSDNEFAMDFRMTHPIFGEVFSYAGTFKTKTMSCTKRS